MNWGVWLRGRLPGIAKLAQRQLGITQLEGHAAKVALVIWSPMERKAKKKRRVWVFISVNIREEKIRL